MWSIIVHAIYMESLRRAIDARFTPEYARLTFKLHGVNEYELSLDVVRPEGNFVRAFIEGYIARIDYEERSSM